MWSPDLKLREDNSEDEDYIDYNNDSYYDVETDIDIQPITNFWEFMLLVLMYPSFFIKLN